jgi:hypothetical protein
MTANIVSTELLQEETTGADCTWVEVLRCKNAVTAEVAFFNHIFLCRGDRDGSFRARTEFMHTSSVPPSWRRTVSQRGKKPMTEGRPARNMQESASATLCFTCASSQSHCERSQSIGGTYHVPGGK